MTFGERQVRAIGVSIVIGVILYGLHLLGILDWLKGML